MELAQGLLYCLGKGLPCLCKDLRFSNAQTLAATGLIGIAQFSFVFALAGPYWTEGGNYHMGLWEVCTSGGDCVDIDSECKFGPSATKLAVSMRKNQLIACAYTCILAANPSSSRSAP